jgi:pimeloyl-ACP methyl ester carboxylesterase
MNIEHHTIEHDGYHWHVVTSGPTDAPPVLLLHCWTGNWSLWEKTMQHLDGQYRFIAPDHLGFGQSDKPRGNYYQIDKQAERAKYILNCFGYERARVVGHSMGGQIALTFAGLYPDTVERLVVVDPAVTGKLHPATNLGYLMLKPVQQWGWAWLPITITKVGLAFPLTAAWTMRTYFPHPYRQLKASTYWAGQIIADGQVYASAWAQKAVMEWDATPLLSKITAPTLALWGIEDYCVPVDECDVLAQHIPQFRDIRIPAIGHFPMIEAWDQYIQAVGDFLQGS